tara:strand:+ start:216 stop:563 length:348 start_codon:yes stop_codon:yes gene_type:complete
MNIEPLHNLLKIYKNKNVVFETFLTEDTLKKIKNKSFYDSIDSDIYLNDNVTFVKKNTGKVFKSGKVITIDGDLITIKTNVNYLTLNLNGYYLFIKQKKNKSNEREFYKALFNSI